MHGCSQKEILYLDDVRLFNATNIHNPVKINNNDIIYFNEEEKIVVYIDVNWSYVIETFMSELKDLPKFEIQDPRVRFFAYKDDELIETNLKEEESDEFHEHEFFIETDFFKSKTWVLLYFSNTLHLSETGTYLIRFELNYKKNGIFKNHLYEISFIIKE